VQNTQANYLMVLATRQGLAYVLRERKMAFPPTRPVRLNVGDRLLLYITAGIFGNPRRDGLVMGIAEVTSPVAPLESRLRLAGREYTSACDLRITGLATVADGVILKAQVEHLRVFQPVTRSWAAYLRRALLLLPAQDADFLFAQLKPSLRDPDEVIPDYLKRINGVP
jgi:hypothetical protein